MWKCCVLPKILKSLTIIILLLVSAHCGTQTNVPSKYLFYLPGGIVLEEGPNAISQHFGKYFYWEILDTLRSHNFVVMSEVKPGTPDSVYVNRVSFQIDSLLQKGTSSENISVVGASAGAYITIDIAFRKKNPSIKYVILGMCWEKTYEKYVGKELCGDFLSIYEASDPHGSCAKIFEGKKCISGFKEIKLSMNNSHAFLYKPYPQWVLPMVNWIRGN